MEFYRSTIIDLVEGLREHGEVISQKGVTARELVGVSIRWPLGIYPVPGSFPSRLAAVCGVSLIAGQFNPSLIQLAEPGIDLSLFDQWAKYSLSLARQVPHAVNLLKREPSTRRAIVYFGRAVDVGGDKTTRISTLHWLIRDGSLHAILNQRTSNLASGFSLDIVSITILSLAVAQYLSVLPGRLVMQVGSLYIPSFSIPTAISARNPLGMVDVRLENPGSYRGWNGIQAEAREHMNATAWEWVKIS